MRKFALCIATAAALASWPAMATEGWPAGLPVYDHIVLVIEENKDFDQIISNPDALFINQLAGEGALFVKMFGEEHDSEGNYFWLFSGNNQNVGFDDKIPKKPLMTSNLGQQLIRSGRSFKGYAEDLPAIGAEDEVGPANCGRRCLYVRKHVPWISFGNLPHGATVESSSNLRFADFPSDYSTLPTVSIVVPNLLHDMHDGTVKAGDEWLSDHLRNYYTWARDHNSLLIVTFDENNNNSSFKGPTDPKSQDRITRNQIATIFAGARIKAGKYDEGQGITHVNILRTIETMFGLPRSGALPDNAVRAGIADDFVVTDIFSSL